MLSKIKSRTLQDLLKVLSGNIVAQGIGFVTIILVSRDLGVEQYGIFSLLLAIFTISVQLSDFGVSTSYVKYVSEHLSNAREIFITVILSKLTLSFVPIVIFYIASSSISEFFFGSVHYKGLLELIAVAILFHSFFRVIVSHFQAIQNFKIFAYLNIGHSVLKILSISIISLCFSQEKHLEYFIMVYAFVVIFLIFGIGLKNYKLFVAVKQIRFDHFIEIYKLGFWVFLSSLAVMVIMRLDVMMLQKMSSSLEVGYYSVAMNLAMIFPLITASLVTTLLPKMEEFLQKNTIEEYIIKVLSKIKYVIVILLILELFAPYIVLLLFGKEYEESISVFQILLLAFTFGIIINPISLVMYSINKAYLLTIMNWVQLPLNYFGNLLLISVWQADGAAISTTILRILGGLYILIYLLKVKK